MKTLAVLSTDPIETILANLTQPWTVIPGVGASPPSQSSQTNPTNDWNSGAWLDFYGIVRDLEGPTDAKIVAIEYEAHESMAQHQLEVLLERVGQHHGVQGFLVLHRLGVVPVGEPSMLVRVLSKHRAPALDACAQFINELKRDVPIWKHPHFA